MGQYMEINDIIRDNLLVENQSKESDVILLTGRGFDCAVDEATDRIVDLLEDGKKEDSSKTVLPDVSKVKLGVIYSFFTKDDEIVNYWSSEAFDHYNWRFRNSGWLPAGDFLDMFPHLGRLRKAVPEGDVK